MTMTPIKSAALLRGTAHLLAMVLVALGLLAVPASAQEQPQATAESDSLDDFSGLYTFLRDGESVQITLTDVPSATRKEVPVDGYVSRMGTSDTDRDQILDIWFKSGSTDGDRISFATKTVHGVSYDFNGHVRRGEAKSRDKEGYMVIEGTLTENSLDKKGKRVSRTRDITMKMFPAFEGPSR
jgi:hypothetical protein